jgi:glutamate racemase
MPSNLPIGIFDSGIGGLTVLRHIRKQMPSESVIYVADRGHLPYGTKSNEFILDRSIHISDFLLSQPVKAIVVACNTATAAAIHILRQRYELPIIGMEPGVKPAIQLTRNGNIGILATEGTLGSGKFKTLIERHANGLELFIKPCYGWVEHIEAGDLGKSLTMSMLKETLAPLLNKDIDTLVLGCTHYPFLMDNIRKLVGSGITIIDTGQAVASHLRCRLEESNLLTDALTAGSETFRSSGPLDEMRDLLERLWQPGASLTALPDQANLS